MKHIYSMVMMTICIMLSSLQQGIAETVTVNTARGEKTIPSKPKKIAVLDPAAADTLTALGIKITAAPLPRHLSYLKAPLASAVGVGSLFEPDFETLFKLKPDLIVAGGRTWKKVPELNRIAPTIDMTIWGPQHFKHVRESVQIYGKIFAIPNKAEALIKKLDNKISQLRKLAIDKGNALIVLTNGSKITAFGKNSRFGWLHADTGIPEAVPSDINKTHGEIISFEFIAKADPEWIFAIDRGSAIGQSGPSAKATLDNELMHETKAWKKQQIIYLNSTNMYLAGGGVTSLMQTMDVLINVLGK